MALSLSNGNTATAAGPGKYWERLTPVELEFANPAKPEYPNKIRVFDDEEANGVVIVQFAARKVATFTFAGWEEFGELFSDELVQIVRGELDKR